MATMPAPPPGAASGESPPGFVSRATRYGCKVTSNERRDCTGRVFALFGELGDKWIATECIEGLALIAGAQGKGERGARLLGVAEAARETFGITMPRPEAGDQEHFWAAIRERTEGTEFAAAWAEGRAMTLEQAIEYALQEETPAEEAHSSPSNVAPD